MKIKLTLFKSLKENLAKRLDLAKAVFIGPKVLSCIEISESHIKLAQFEATQEGKKLIGLFTRKIPSGEAEVVIKTLQSVLSELKIKGRIFTCLARHQVTLRYLKLPSRNPQEWEQMLDFQLTRLIPYPKEEMVYAWSILNIDTSGYAHLLLAIVHQQTVFEHLRLLKACNLEPQNISFNALSACQWFLYGNLKIPEPVLIIDIDTVYTNIGVINTQGLLFSRAIKWGVEDLESNQNQSAWDYLKEEIRLSLSAYAKESGQVKVNRIVLTGASLVLDKIKEVLENEFTFEIEIRLALDKVKLKPAVLEEDWFDLQRVSLNAVLGLGLEEDVPTRFNLLPLSVKDERLKRKKQHQVIFSLTLVGLIFFTALGFFSKKFHDKYISLRYLNQQITKISDLAIGLEEKKRNLELVKELFYNRGISLEIIYELHKIVPPEINLINFDFEDKRGLTLRGTSQTMPEVFRFKATLDKSVYFTNSQLRFARKRPGTEVLADFEIYCEINPQVWSKSK